MWRHTHTHTYTCVEGGLYKFINNLGIYEIVLHFPELVVSAGQDYLNMRNLCEFLRKEYKQLLFFDKHGRTSEGSVDSVMIRPLLFSYKILHLLFHAMSPLRQFFCIVTH